MALGRRWCDNRRLDKPLAKIADIGNRDGLISATHERIEWFPCPGPISGGSNSGEQKNVAAELPPATQQWRCGRSQGGCQRSTLTAMLRPISVEKVAMCAMSFAKSLSFAIASCALP